MRQRMSLPGMTAFAVLLLALNFLAAGCRSTPKVDWNSRVGTYTYDQAVVELGPPDKFARLTDGKTVTEWITRRGGGSGFNIGTGIFGSHTGVTLGHGIGTSRGDKVLRLVFDQENKLAAWAKNY